MALEAVGSSPIIHPINKLIMIGVSPSGKAPDFDSGISLVQIQPPQPVIQ